MSQPSLERERMQCGFGSDLLFSAHAGSVLDRGTGDGCMCQRGLRRQAEHGAVLEGDGD